MFRNLTLQNSLDSCISFEVVSGENTTNVTLRDSTLRNCSGKSDFLPLLKSKKYTHISCHKQYCHNQTQWHGDMITDHNKNTNKQSHFNYYSPSPCVHMHTQAANGQKTTAIYAHIWSSQTQTPHSHVLSYTQAHTCAGNHTLSATPSNIFACSVFKYTL